MAAYTCIKKIAVFDSEQNMLIVFEEGQILVNPSHSIINEMKQKDALGDYRYLSDGEVLKKNRTELLRYCNEIGYYDVNKNLRIEELRANIIAFTNGERHD